MMELFDFTECKLSSRDLHYGGRAGEKRGIILDDEFWFLKFPKNTIGMRRIKNLSYVTSPLSEFIGSNIYKILGIDVHDTKLGICRVGEKTKVVCACKDFIINNQEELLVPYTALRNDSEPSIIEAFDEISRDPSDINEIIFQLRHNKSFLSIPNSEERFWDVAIIDALINNNDRNEDNWGLIVNLKSGEYRLAPVFDNGNSFYSKIDDETLKSRLEIPDRLLESSTYCLTAYVQNGKEMTIKDLLNLNNYALQKSLIKIVFLFESRFDQIQSFINSIPNEFKNVPIISETRKSYYLKTMEIRLEMLKQKIGR